MRYAGLFELFEQGLIRRAHANAAVDDEHTDVCPSQYLAGFRHAHLAQTADVVNAGGVNDDHGPEGQELHGLGHGVGGGALLIRNDGEGLTGDGVDDGGFTGVPAPEEGDVGPVGLRDFVQRHINSFPKEKLRRRTQLYRRVTDSRSFTSSEFRRQATRGIRCWSRRPSP